MALMLVVHTEDFLDIMLQVGCAQSLHGCLQIVGLDVPNSMHQGRRFAPGTRQQCRSRVRKCFMHRWVGLYGGVDTLAMSISLANKRGVCTRRRST